LENNRKIKSKLYVHASDDETDEEADRLFFAMEEQRRMKNNNGGGGMAAKAMALIKAARERETGKGRKGKTPKGKGKRNSDIAGDGEGIENLSSEDETRVTKRRRSTKKVTLDDSDENDDLEEDDEPLEDITTSQASGAEIQLPTQRPRGRAPFLDDSDDDAPVMLSDSEAETDTPPSSAPDNSKAREKKVADDADADVDMEHAETQGSDKENVADGMEVDAAVDRIPEKVAPLTRPRGRAGFVLDDSDDE